MDEWNDFFTTSAGAAAALVGLIFVGVSINLEMIMANPRYGLAGRTLEVFVMLVAVLIITSLLLMPAQGTVVGLEVLVIGIANWAAIVAIQLLQLRKNWHLLEANLRSYFVGRVVRGK